MSKQNIKTTPQPVETVLERPDLYVSRICHKYTGEFLRLGDGVFLYRKDGVSVLVRPNSTFLCWDRSNNVGYAVRKVPQGPKYTGPIDDEMMANILMFGG